MYRKICIILLILLTSLILTAYTMVNQTSYNCIPASIEMIYKHYNVNDVSQSNIRHDIGYEGEIYVDDMEKYLEDNFIYTKKEVCCVDSLINSMVEYPILMVLDQSRLSFRNYKGYAIVGVELEIEDENVYIKVLDPDGGIEIWYNAIQIYNALKGWNEYVYIIKGIK